MTPMQKAERDIEELRRSIRRMFRDHLSNLTLSREDRAAISRGIKSLQEDGSRKNLSAATERVMPSPSSLPTSMDYLLLLNFNCAGGGRPTFFAGIGQVAQVRIV